MEWIDVKTLTVRREFRAGEWLRLSGEKTPCLDLRRDCGIGCECSAQILKAVPGPELAEQKCLCFNDRTKQGISEVKGTAKAIKEGPDEWIYEVQANLVEARQNVKVSGPEAALSPEGRARLPGSTPATNGERKP